MRQPFLIWITGLSGSGKTTIGKAVYKIVKKKYNHTIFIDGDSFRKIIGKTNNFSRKERFEVAMQISRLCFFLTEQNINVICSTISLFKDVHRLNRNLQKNYLEVFIECEMNELIKRDQKKIYSKAIKGQMKNVTGVNQSFDYPENPDIILNNTFSDSLKENINKIISKIKL